MLDAAKLTARVVATAALAAGLVVNSGTAYAADLSAAPGTQTRAVDVAPTGSPAWQDDDERWRHHDETSNDTSTTVHSSGSGPVAVNSAAGGYADQHVDQSIHDSSTHTRYRDDSRVDSHDNHNSHNSSSYRDAGRR